MKRFYLLYLWLGVFGLSACSALTPESPRGDLLLWHDWSERDTVVLERMLAQYEDVNEEIDIIAVQIPSDQLLTRFQETAALGLGPDLIFGSHEWVRPLAEAELIRPITLLQDDLFEQNALQALQIEGELFGRPYALTTNILYYNRNSVERPADSFSDLFRQAESGCQTEVTATVDPTAEATPVPESTPIEAASVGERDGCIIGISTVFDEALWGVGVFGNPLISEDGSLNPISDGFEGWLAWLREAQLSPNIILTRDRLTLRQLFTGGVIDYYVAGSADYELLTEIMGNGLVGVTLLPNSPAQLVSAEPNGFATPVLGVEALYFNSASSDNHFTLAQDVARFLTNTTQSTVAMRQTFRVPANLRVTISAEVDQPQFTFREQAETARPLPNHIDHALLRRVGERVYANVLTGVSEPSVGICNFTRELTGGNANCIPTEESNGE